MNISVSNKFVQVNKPRILVINLQLNYIKLSNGTALASMIINLFKVHFRMYNHQEDNRLGIHYYPDTLHYREQDLIKWLPELKELGVSWLSLIAPVERAIPEYFLSGLINSKITPILQFRTQVKPLNLNDSFNLILKNYADWGIKYIVVFDRPNIRRAWKSDLWMHDDLVENFLDIFIPIANRLIEFGIDPIFPPLQPGGEFWDTTFLLLALQGLKRRNCSNLIDKLIIGAHAWSNQHSLDWGAGGPERWPGAKPYNTQPGTEDQRGFRIFDWYSAIINAELSHSQKIILLKTGLHDPETPYQVDPLYHAETCLAIAQAMFQNIPSSNGKKKKVPDNVLSCNFWLLSSSEDSPYKEQAWYKTGGSHLPVVNYLKNWEQKKQNVLESLKRESLTNNGTNKGFSLNHHAHERKIRHYLLLPLQTWDATDEIKSNLLSFVQHYHPTVGFSLDEALLSRRVTLLGDLNDYPSGTVDLLLNSSSRLEHLRVDGTLLAIKDMTQKDNLSKINDQPRKEIHE